MRIKGSVRQVPHPITGQLRWSFYPSTREAAYLEDVAKFWPQTPCPVHGGEPVVYTKTGIHGCCAQRDAVEAYNTALRAGEPTNPQDAMARGLNYYWTPQEPQMCGHTGKRTLKGKCFGCTHSEKSPRQQAIIAGQTWYQPSTPCIQGHYARRRVTNGSCEQCEQIVAQKQEPKVRGDEPSKALMRDFPDTIISREDAQAAGFVVYRTGDPCRRGHTGFRYVSTGNCLDCRK